MVMKSAQHALDYDMRLYPPAAMKEHLASLNDALRECMATLLGRSIPTLAWMQCSLPGRFGGMALRTANPEPLAAATYAAAHDAHWSVLPTLLAQLGRGDAAAHGCENEYAEAARRWLHDAGVAVASGAMIALTKEGAATFEGPPWAYECPPDTLVRARPRQQAADEDALEPVKSMARTLEHGRLLSRIMSALEGISAAKLAMALGTEGANMLMSAGGPGAGGTWTAPHRHVLDLMPNALWRTATCMRLGLVQRAAGGVCQLPVTKGADHGGDICGRPCAEDVWHPIHCQHGAAKQRPHRLLQKALSRRFGCLWSTRR